MPNFKIPDNLAISDNGFMFLPSTGETFTLNETGRVVFKLMQQGHTDNEINNNILEEYDIDKNTVERDLQEFFLQLSNLNLIKEI